MQVNNMATMRDAMKEVYNTLNKIRSFTPQLKDVSLMRKFSHMVCHAKRVIDVALSEPPRNCDVEMPKEQCARDIMCSEDFERIFNVRLAEKCCANCKHGECEYEGCATCRHPKRNDGGYTFEEGELATKYYSSNVYQCDVCDLWEAKGANGER